MKRPGLQQKNTVVKPSDAFHHLPQYGVYKWFRGWSGGPFVGAAEPVSRRCLSGRSTSLFDVDLPGKLAKSSLMAQLTDRLVWDKVTVKDRTTVLVDAPLIGICGAVHMEELMPMQSIGEADPLGLRERLLL